MQRNKCLRIMGGAVGARNYLKFTAMELSTIALTAVGNPLAVSLVTSLNGGAWQAYTTGNTLTLNQGDELRMRAATTNNAMAANETNYHKFVMTGSISASGNVVSLLDSTLHQRTLGSCSFTSLFQGCTSLVDAPEMIVNTYGQDSCRSMYQGCTALVSAPRITGKVVNSSCFMQMFYGCTALVGAPIFDNVLTGTFHGVFRSMFQGCTSLVTAPAINIGNFSCYYTFNSTFRGCTSLADASAIQLGRVTVQSKAFQDTFRDCTALKRGFTLDCDFADQVSWDDFHSMFYGCTSLETAPTITLDATTAVTRSIHVHSMFYGCTALVDASHVTFIGKWSTNQYYGIFINCYALLHQPNFLPSMQKSTRYAECFRNCTSLQRAEIPDELTQGTDWADNFLYRCFYGCTSLVDVTVHFTAWPDAGVLNPLSGWLPSNAGTLHVPPTLDISDPTAHGIPSTWTIVQDVV